MLNAKTKKDAIAQCKAAAVQYEKTRSETIECATALHSTKEEAVSILRDADDLVFAVQNRPGDVEETMVVATAARTAFEKKLNALALQEASTLAMESKKVDKMGKRMAGAGVATGAGVAAFAPSVAMAIATTFGTASTGTAIAALSGAAATNAALAWLGGGALAAAGGGMAGGQALLAMAGPVGWAIGGASLLGGGLMANSRNKALAEKARAQTMTIKKQTNDLKMLLVKVKKEIDVLNNLNMGLAELLRQLKQIGHVNYDIYTDEQKDVLCQMVNTSKALSKRLGEIIE